MSAGGRWAATRPAFFASDSSRIEAQWTVEAPLSGTTIRALDVTTDVDGRVNEVFRKLLDGQRHSYAIYTMVGPTVNLTERYNVESYNGPIDELGGILGTPLVEPDSEFIRLLKGGAVWRYQGTRLTHSRVYLGNLNTTIVPVYKRTFVREWRLSLPQAFTQTSAYNPAQQQFTQG